LYFLQRYCILWSMKTRSYNQHCGLAYALDKVGERWTLLIIRELIAGPRRFSDLLEGLPGISTNLLSERLKELEQQGMLRRRRLAPPAASSVYELTAVGRALEQALLELGRWGSQFVPASREGATLLGASSYALTLKTFFRRERARGLNETYELHIDNEVLQVHIQDGEIEVRQGEALNAAMVLHTDMATYLGLLSGEIQPEEASERTLMRIEGDGEALRRFLSVCGLPSALEKGSVAV
jgi:DNA-binding HxlR family transcriptional regulator